MTDTCSTNVAFLDFPGEMAALIYNGAWAPVPGQKHPWALRRAGGEVWAEIWDIIGPTFDQVTHEGVATWSEDQLLPLDRFGYVEECYLYYSYSPARGEDGRVEGVFTAVTETTHRVLTERRERLLRLVNTLLNISRIEAGRVRAAFEPVDLAAYTAELASSFRSAMEHAGLDYRIDTATFDEPVWVDREMWEKIVLNLVSNAFKYTLAGTVAVRLRPAAGAVRLEVADTGVGTPADELPKVFDRFHRIEGQHGRMHEGAGIGLALVKDLATCPPTPRRRRRASRPRPGPTPSWRRPCAGCRGRGGAGAG